MKIQFIGATYEVTGSCTLLEVCGKKYLVDCGMEQGIDVAFERIHPLRDGNGRVGRLILFKECLKHNIVPFIIEDNLKLFYYRGLKEWDQVKGFLIDACLTAQDRFKADLDYYRIAY